MRKSASEVLRSLEGRIARLENNTSRTKSAAQTANLSNARAIVMVDDRYSKEDKIHLCFMHMDRSILKKSVSDFEKSISGVWPYSEIVEDYYVTSKCESCICITVEIADPSFWGEDVLESGVRWIRETIINLPNSIPAS